MFGDPACPNCHSDDLDHYGTHAGIRYYRCRKCLVKFKWRAGPRKPSTPTAVLWGGGASAIADGAERKAPSVGDATHFACHLHHAFIPVKAHVIFSADQLGCKIADQQDAAGALKLCAPYRFTAPDGWAVLESKEEKGYWPAGPGDPLRYGHDTGLCLLSYVDRCGFDPIYLIGYDMDGEADGSKKGSHRVSLEVWEEVRSKIRGHLVQTNPESKLQPII